MEVRTGTRPDNGLRTGPRERTPLGGAPRSKKFRRAESAKANEQAWGSPSEKMQTRVPQGEKEVP